MCYSLETIMPKLSILQPNNRMCSYKIAIRMQSLKESARYLPDIHHFMNAIY